LKKKLLVSLSLQVEMSNHSSSAREEVVTIDKLQYLRHKICTLIKGEIPNAELLTAFEELGKEVQRQEELKQQERLSLQKKLSSQEKLKRKEEIRQQEELKKCFERKEAQPTLDSYIKILPAVKRPREPESLFSEKRIRAPQTEKCTGCKEKNAHCEVEEGSRHVFVIFVYSLFYLSHSIFLSTEGVNVVLGDT